MEQSPKAAQPKDRDYLIRYIKSVGLTPPEEAPIEELEDLVTQARKLKIRRRLDLPDDATDTEVETKKEHNRRLQILQEEGLPEDTSDEEYQLILQIKEEAFRNFEKWKSNQEYLHGAGLPDGLSAYEHNEYIKERRKLLDKRGYGLSDDATDEELELAHKAYSGLRKRRRLGLRDDATDEELELAQRTLKERRSQATSKEEMAAIDEDFKAYLLRADLELPADATDEVVAYRVAVRDEEFRLGMHKIF